MGDKNKKVRQESAKIESIDTIEIKAEKQKQLSADLVSLTLEHPVLTHTSMVKVMLGYH